MFLTLKLECIAVSVSVAVAVDVAVDVPMQVAIAVHDVVNAVMMAVLTVAVAVHLCFCSYPRLSADSCDGCLSLCLNLSLSVSVDVSPQSVSTRPSWRPDRGGATEGQVGHDRSVCLFFFFKVF